jgi:hypothetical protein
MLIMIKTTPLLLLFIITQTQFLCGGAHHYHGSPHTQGTRSQLPSATEKKLLARIARLK